MTKDKFDSKQYWEQRLREHYDLSGVGYLSLGSSYNGWLYKIRKYIFNKYAKSLTAMTDSISVLDIGSGTGFYIDRWKESGVSRISGADLTEVAVKQLRAKYPDTGFYQLDIGCDQINGIGNYDIVSAFDVLFHIVDDRRFKSSIRNIYSLLNPGGYFIFSDNFLHSRELRLSHQANRSLEDIEEILQTAGFEVVMRKPMFVVMNAPIDMSNRVIPLAWRAMAKVISLTDIFGFIAGAVLYPIELILLSLVKESPSTEIMICRKPCNTTKD